MCGTDLAEEALEEVGGEEVPGDGFRDGREYPVLVLTVLYVHLTVLFWS